MMVLYMYICITLYNCIACSSLKDWIKELWMSFSTAKATFSHAGEP